MKIASINIANLSPRQLADVLTGIQEAFHWSSGGDISLSLKLNADKTLGVYR